MIHKIFSIFDEKAEAFHQPFFSTNGLTAMRAIQSAINDQQHNYCKFAADYTMFEIGAYDDSNGAIEGIEIHVNLGNLLTLKTEANDGQ